VRELQRASVASYALGWLHLKVLPVGHRIRRSVYAINGFLSGSLYEYSSPFERPFCNRPTGYGADGSAWWEGSGSTRS